MSGMLADAQGLNKLSSAAGINDSEGTPRMIYSSRYNSKPVLKNSSNTKADQPGVGPNFQGLRVQKVPIHRRVNEKGARLAWTESGKGITSVGVDNQEELVGEDKTEDTDRDGNPLKTFTQNPPLSNPQIVSAKPLMWSRESLRKLAVTNYANVEIQEVNNAVGGGRSSHSKDVALGRGLDRLSGAISGERDLRKTFFNQRNRGVKSPRNQLSDDKGSEGLTPIKKSKLGFSGGATSGSITFR